MALLVMLAIGVVEAVSLLTGFSPSGSIEEALPDIDPPEADLDVDAPAMSGAELGPFSLILGWLSVGRVPLLIILVILLTSFGLAGYVVQLLAKQAIGFPISPWIASVPALIAAAYTSRHLGRWLGRIFPRDETEAASQRELIGSYATIIRGEAKAGHPAEAKTTDLRGRTHYVLLVPNDPATTYSAGDRVFIVGQDKNIYRAITKLSTP